MAPFDPPALAVRPATAADLDAVVATLTTAFFHDPVWGPAFPDVAVRSAQASAFWRLLVTSSLRHPWTLVTENAESVANWIPPGGSELTEAEEHGLADFLVDLGGRPVADGIVGMFDRFDAARPSEPHYYLSLLATHDDHRGQGLGMRLLAENLRRIDALGVPTYLESSNPANDRRYQRLGFQPTGRITMPAGQLVTTLWRPVPTPG